LVIDSPPVTVVSDTAALASRTDGVLLVFAREKMNRDIAQKTLGALRQVNAYMLGVVLNRVTSSEHGYYYSYHKSYRDRYYSGYYASRRHTKAAAETAAVVSPQPVSRASITNGAPLETERAGQPKSVK
jgi:Mrp family chromosome partitioning ATPase